MLNFSWRGLKIASMAPHHNAPEDHPGAPLEDNPDPWSRMVVASPPNPWDHSAGRTGNWGRVSRTIALVVLLAGVLLLSASLSHGVFTANSQNAAADPGEPNLSLGSGPDTEQTAPAHASSTTATESEQAAPQFTESPTPSTEPSSVTSSGHQDQTEAASAQAWEPVSPGPAVNPVGEPVAPVSATSRFQAPVTAVQCAANVNWRIYAGTTVTSCPFAENVAIAMAGNAGTTTSHQVAVVSPVTEQRYQMTCTTEGGGSFICRGGEDAVVVLEHRADL